MNSHDKATGKGHIRIEICRLPYVQRKLMQFAYFIGLDEIGHYLRETYGVMKSVAEANNTLTNGRLAVLAGLEGNTGAQTAFGYLALGTDATAPAASQTALIAETIVSGLARAAATITRITTAQANDTLRLFKVFTVGGGVVGTTTINEIGYFNDPTAGVMGGRALTGAKALIAGDTLTAIYTIQQI